MSWKIERLGNLLFESKVLSENPNPEKRIRVKLNLGGVVKRPIENEVKGATKQFIRKSGQFIYGKQNFHKGAFGVIPNELDEFESSSDIPSFDVSDKCYPEWIFYFFKIDNRYKDLEKLARGVGSKRIHPNQIFELEIPLPDKQIQKKIIDKIRKYERIGNNYSKIFENQQTYITKLRQAFLTEAMQGKLVPQDPNDEPASELIKKIKAEKEKKIKKSKPLPPIKSEEIPYEIPVSWVWVRLGEVIDLISGQHILESNYNTESLGLPYLTGPSDFGEIFPIPTRWTITPKVTANRGDILITVKGSGVGKINFNNLSRIAISRQLMAIRNENNSLRYMYYFLKNNMDFLQSKKKGTGIPGISREEINNLLLPLPYHAEQKRIVDKLDKLMQKCDELEANINTTKEQTEQLIEVLLKEALNPQE